MESLNIGLQVVMLNKLKKINPIFCIIVLSFIIRLVNINQSLWLDEAAQAVESSRPLNQQLNIVGDFQPPLLHYIVHFFYQISSADWFLRLPSVIAGVITIVFAYKITEHLFNKKIAFTVGLLGATSSYHYYFSQELRQYSLAAMWAAISMWYFIKWIGTKSDKISLGYILSTSAGMYSMYVFPFLVLYQLIYVLLVASKKSVSFIKQLFIAGLIFAPWLPMFFKQLKAGMGLKENFAGWATAVSLPWAKSLPLTAIRFVIGMIPVELSIFQITLFSLVFSSIIYIIKPVIKSKTIKPILFWLIAPILLSFLFSFFIPVLEPKRVMFVLPAFWIILAVGLHQYKLKNILISLILFAQIFLLGIHMTSPSLKRENWKQAVAFVQDSSYQDKAVIFAFPGAFAPWTWYQKDVVPHYATKTLKVPSISYLDEALGKSLDYETIFVFEYLMDLSDPDRYVFSWLELHNYTNTEIKDFHGVGFIHIYQRVTPLALN